MPGPRLDDVAAEPEVDEQRGEHEKMFAQPHRLSVQETTTADDAPQPATQDTFGAALDGLTFAEVEETAGELHRRVAAALREIGERRADRGGRASPRARVAGLVIATELTALILGAAAAGSEAHVPRLDDHPSSVAAFMYAAPTLPQLLGRLDQNRRLVASLARTLEGRLDEERPTPWGAMPLRRLVSDVLIVRPARVGLELDSAASEADA